MLAPPLPGIGGHELSPAGRREFWYQSFHRLPLAEILIDGKPDAVRAYLGHFWERWSGPGFDIEGAELDLLVERYAEPGAFRASIAWYRAGTDAYALNEPVHGPAERVATPLTLLWPEHDPLFPRAWSDEVTRYYSNSTVRPVDGVGHFAPLEYPDMMAAALCAALVESAEPTECAASDGGSRTPRNDLPDKTS